EIASREPMMLPLLTDHHAEASPDLDWLRRRDPRRVARRWPVELFGREPISEIAHEAQVPAAHCEDLGARRRCKNVDTPSLHDVARIGLTRSKIRRHPETVPSVRVADRVAPE